MRKAFFVDDINPLSLWDDYMDGVDRTTMEPLSRG
jgi:hypothetical protein